MRAKINRTLDIIDAMFEPGSTPRSSALRLELKQNIEQVQDAYIEIIQQALRLLMMDRMDECHSLLHDQRESLVSTFERIGTVIEAFSDSDEALIKTVVEFLFTRARLIDELKMFPAFGLELLERLSLDESIDATVDYMEVVMTSKKNLYSRVINALTEVS